MSAEQAVAQLLRESAEWRRLFKRCCEVSTLRLRSAVPQFRDELTARGHEIPTEDVEDALLILARKLLPETPAARWDPEWGHQLCKRALARAAALYGELSEEEQDAADLERAEAVWIDQANAAAEANDPTAFRAAVKGWERALVDELEGTRTRPGAA